MNHESSGEGREDKWKNFNESLDDADPQSHNLSQNVDDEGLRGSRSDIIDHER
jgi:hypothetical protein